MPLPLLCSLSSPTFSISLGFSHLCTLSLELSHPCTLSLCTRRLYSLSLELSHPSLVNRFFIFLINPKGIWIGGLLQKIF
ncbi:hypothetical protein AMTRI_Chr13g125710 [Amborella trichopoda]